MAVFYFITTEALGVRWSFDRPDGLLGMKIAHSSAFLDPQALSAEESAAFADIKAKSALTVTMAAGEFAAALQTGVIDGAILPLSAGLDGVKAIDAATASGFYAYTVEAGGRVAPLDLGNGSNYAPPDGTPPPTDPGGEEPGANDPGANGYDFDLVLRKDLGIDALSQLDGVSIALIAGSQEEKEISGFFRDKLMDFQPVLFRTEDEARLAYEAGRTDAWGLTLSFGARRVGQLLDEPADHMILQADGFAPGPPFTPAYVANIALVYEAGLGREADIAGLNFWIDQALAGMDLTTMAGLFLDSTEFTSRFGDDDAMSNALYVDLMYRNVLGRQGEQAGVDYWVGAMNGGVSRESVVVGFAVSPENIEGSRANGLQQTSAGYWDFW